MARALLVLDSPVSRSRAASWCMRLPHGTRAEFKQSKRSNDQNAKMWAMLTEVATQVPWHGLTLRPDDYKLIFLDALKREVRAVPNLDGTGFVNIGRSSSDLSKSEMADLITLIEAFGAERGVVFADDREASHAA